MFLVPNIDQMYKEMKKIVEDGNKHGNGGKILGSTGNTLFFFFFWPKEKFHAPILYIPLYNLGICHLSTSMIYCL